MILSRGRADRVLTHATLRASGWDREIVILLDDDDKTRGDYERICGRDPLVRIETFPVAEVRARTDTMVCSNDRRGGILFARNACFDVARRLGVRYFLQLDDDYTDFLYRVKPDGSIGGTMIRSTIVDVFDAFLDFLHATGALSVAFLQGGDFLFHANLLSMLWRKAMNSFFCDVERPFEFRGIINEDVNTYAALGSRGHLFFSVPPLQLNQVQTQADPGGQTGLYKSGTYQKSMFTVIACPSFTKVRAMGTFYYRTHHDWRHGVPKIVSESLRR